MALKAQLDSVDGLPEVVRKEYKQVDLADGTKVWRLDVEKVGGLELTDPTGLISTVEKLRQHERTIGQFGTITPAEAQANVRRVAELTQENEALKSEVSKKGGADAEARVKQVTDEMTKRHAAEVASHAKKSDARLAEVVRLRKVEAAANALKDAGFKSALRLMSPLLVGELDVVEEDDGTFRTVVRGEGGVERIFVDKKTNASRPMTAADRAAEMALDPELKRYVDAEPPPTKPAAPTTKHATPLPSSSGGGGDGFMDPVEMLVTSRGGTL